MAAALSWPAKSPTGPIEIVARLHQDFIGGSKFASFYIPAASNAFVICGELLKSVPNSLGLSRASYTLRWDTPELPRMQRRLYSPVTCTYILKQTLPLTNSPHCGTLPTNFRR
jgi:hypothetical protein